MTLLLKNLLFTLVVPASVGFFAQLLLAGDRRPRSGAWMILAMVLFAIGIGMYLWSVWNFGARGRGTPLPLDAPRRLVIHGPYRYTRNPMYVALFSALIGWLTLFPTYRMAIYIVFCLVAVNLFVRAYEEPHLRQVFGVDYEAYMGRVPRWLPRFSRQPDA